MTLLLHNTAPFPYVPERKSCRERLAGQSRFSRAGRTMALLSLGVASLASAVAFMASAAIVMPILAEQFHTWVAGHHWSAVPLSSLLTKMGYPLYSHDALISPIVDWLLTLEAGLLLVPTAMVFAWMVWMFEQCVSSGFDPHALGPSGQLRDPFQARRQ